MSSAHWAGATGAVHWNSNTYTNNCTCGFGTGPCWVHTTTSTPGIVMTSTGTSGSWHPFPMYVEKVEIVDGVAVCYGKAGEVLLTIPLEAVRRILDASVLDAFIGKADAR